MKIIVLLLSIFLTSLSQMGCSRITYKSGDEPFAVMLTKGEGSPEAGISIKGSQKQWFLFWGFSKLNEVTLQDLIYDADGRHGFVRNISIKETKDPFDLAITLVSLGILSPYTISMEGEIVPQ